MNLTRRTLSGGSWQLASVISRAILQLVVLSVLARYITAEEFGVVAIASMVLAFVGLFAEGGVGSAIIQIKALRTGHVQSAFWAMMLLGVVFVLLMWVTAPFIVQFFRVEEALDLVRFMGVVFVANTYGSVSGALLAREMEFKALFVVTLISFVFGYGLVGVVCAIQGFGAWSIVIAMCTQGLIRSTLMLWMKPHSILLKFSRQELQEVLHFGGGLVLARFFLFGATQGDYIVIGRALGVVPLGLYERAFQIIQLPAQYVGNVLDRVLFPAFSMIQDRTDKIREVFLQSISFVFTLMVPSMLMLIVLAPEVVGIILGPKWPDTIVPLQILLLSVPFRTAIQMSDAVARAIGAVYRNAIRKCLYMAAVLAGSLVGQQWGISGVAVGVDIAVLFHALIMVHLSISLVGGRWRDYGRALRPTVLLTAIVLPVGVVLTYGFRAWLNADALVFIGVAGVLTPLTLGLIYRYPRLLGREGIQTILQVLPMVPGGARLKPRFEGALHKIQP